MSIIIDSVSQRSVEIAERKGAGHPDTVCDAIAEAISVALCRYYLREFGAVLHHNVDKALLVGGQSAPTFGGGEVLQPIELIVAGRATRQVGDRVVPVDEIAVETARDWLRRHFRFLDVDRHVRITPRIRPGSSDLVELFTRFGRGETPLANDTSFGAGFYPLTSLEATILAIDSALQAPAAREHLPFIGEDTKVMGVRKKDRSLFTVAIAGVDRFVRDIPDYRNQIEAAGRYLREHLPLAGAALAINTADDYARGSVYLTVTGTSAEGGDDGQVGRGNRANGLITPYRPMSLEALAGKNPVSHVGKIYNLFAMDLARAIVQRELAAAAEVFLVSQIGRPIDQPQALHLVLSGPQAAPAEIEAFAAGQLERLAGFWKTVVAGDGA